MFDVNDNDTFWPLVAAVGQLTEQLNGWIVPLMAYTGSSTAAQLAAQLQASADRIEREPDGPRKEATVGVFRALAQYIEDIDHHIEKELNHE